MVATNCVPGCVVKVPVALTAVILSFPKDDLLDLPIIPPFNDPPLLLGINVLLCGHPS
jgi:hypothetical protein